jgi:hypothetical protein
MLLGEGASFVVISNSEQCKRSMPSNCPRFAKMLITDTLTTDYFETIILCDVLTAARLLASGSWLLSLNSLNS